jgi:hypothetical protein
LFLIVSVFAVGFGASAAFGYAIGYAVGHMDGARASSRRPDPEATE